MAIGDNITKLSGMSFPFRRSGASDFVSATGDAAIRADIIFALSTPLGFLPWRPDFGSKLSTLRHSLNTTVLREAARIHIQDCLAKWCPYARVLDVDVTPNRDDKTLKISLRYQIIRNNVPVGPELSNTFITAAS